MKSLPRIFQASPYTGCSEYSRLLPTYYFDDRIDLVIVADAIKFIVGNRSAVLVDCGAGPGRFWSMVPARVKIIGVEPNVAMWRKDISPRWQYIESTGFNYLRELSHSPDLISWVWSLNYELLSFFEEYEASTRSIVVKDWKKGDQEARAMLGSILDAHRASHIIVVFFDGDSEEQNLVTSIWESEAPFPFHERGYTRHLWEDVAVQHCERTGRTFKRQHLLGKAEYGSMPVAQERFLGFHLRGHFNDRPSVIDVVREELGRYRSSSGIVEIPASCYVYSLSPVTKNCDL